MRASTRLSGQASLCPRRRRNLKNISFEELKTVPDILKAFPSLVPALS